MDDIVVGEALRGLLGGFVRLRRLDVSLEGNRGGFDRVVIAAIRAWVVLS